jgi:hypothetical protein
MVVGQVEVGSRPVRPKVAKVDPHGLRAAVDEVLGEVELVERLVPELLLGLRVKNPVADARQRRRDDQGTDEIRSSLSESPCNCPMWTN